MFDKNQDSLIRALQNPSAYPHDTDRFQLIETHISWVFLCGPYAYKIKKAVNLGFLDFSTLGKRRFYCEEELRLNGRLAPALYLAVVPITGTPEQPRMGGSGEAIEYAVKMCRFPQETLLSHRVRRDLLTNTHIDQIILQVAGFHRSIPAASAGTRYGDPDQVAAPVNENLLQIRELTQEPRHIEMLDRMNAWAEQEHQTRHGWFRKRKKLGFIRECHGDMHLGNMAIVDDRLVIFDGIEFNPDLYWIDVMSEVAFLCMDLEDDKKRNFAFRFLNGYLDLTGDYEGLRVFRYYLAYRAMVRAKVAGIRFSQTAEHGVQSPEAREFDRYLQLALGYTQPQRPVLFLTHGLSGSGKSTLSGPLSEHLGAIRIRSDRERQRLFGKDKIEGEATAIDQGAYSNDATRQTYTRLAQLAAAVLQSGHSVIIDATFLRRQQRTPFKQLADRFEVPVRILFFQADADVLRRRIRERERDGRDISEADVSVLEHQLAMYAGLDGDERGYTVTIDTESVVETEKILALVNKSLGCHRACETAAG